MSNKRSDLLLVKLAPEGIMPEDEFVASGAATKVGDVVVVLCRYLIEVFTDVRIFVLFAFVRRLILME